MTTHHLEHRSKPNTMGVQTRVVSSKLQGPWADTPTQAWKAYKAARKLQDGPRPRRIQLQRTAGWRKPDDAVVVTRPGPWGNPFVPEAVHGGWLLAVHGNKNRIDATVRAIAREANATAPWVTKIAATRGAVAAFRRLHDNEISRGSMRHHLKGKVLACWCKVGECCHADVLLEFANDWKPRACMSIGTSDGPEIADFPSPVAAEIDAAAVAAEFLAALEANLLTPTP